MKDGSVEKVILYYPLSPASVVLNQVQAVVLLHIWSLQPGGEQAARIRGTSSLCWLACWQTSRYHYCGDSYI